MENKKEVYTVGDKFVFLPKEGFVFHGEKYEIRAIDDDYLALVNSSNGNYWYKPIPVKDFANISQNEVKGLFGQWLKHFQRC